MEEYKLQGTGEQEPPKRRTELLTILCIVTFIFSGLSAFSNLLWAILHQTIIALVESGEVVFPGIEYYIGLPKSFFIISFVFYFTSVIGAIRMWNLKKIGFHIYTVSQIIILITPSFYGQLASISIFNVLMTAIFIILYAIHLKHMS